MIVDSNKKHTSTGRGLNTVDVKYQDPFSDVYRENEYALLVSGVTREMISHLKQENPKTRKDMLREMEVVVFHLLSHQSRFVYYDKESPISLKKFKSLATKLEQTFPEIVVYKSGWAVNGGNAVPPAVGLLPHKVQELLENYTQDGGFDLKDFI